MSADAAKAIVDANRFMTLATADANGRPWASPVWFATADYREFFWVSKPHARHSRNVAVRPQVAVVIFDSRVRPGQASAVYMSGEAVELDGDDAARGIELFSRRSVEQELAAWSIEDVAAGARHRLYRATVHQHFLLDERDERAEVDLSAGG